MLRRLAWGQLVVVVSLSGCPAAEPVPDPDGGHDARPPEDAGAPIDASAPDAGGCADPDEDGDGADAIACGGLDCDDDDPQRAPGRTEVCDVADHDEDCDPSTYGYRDTDGDDAPDAACCNGTGAAMVCGDDCDDMRAGVHPDATETCDGRDNDCDTRIDEGVLETFYRDADGDLHGAIDGASMELCAASGEYRALVADDCNDGAVGVHPGATDTCNDVDDDCMLPTDPPECLCTTGETTTCGYDTSCTPVMAGCVGGAFACPPGLRTGGEAELCNGVDDNCVGGIDEGCPCRPVGMTRSCSTGGRVGACAVGTERCEPSGYAGCASPATEVCGPVDDDCDSRTDEGMHVWAITVADPCNTTAPVGTQACAQRVANACAGRGAPANECTGRSGFGPVGIAAGLMSIVCLDRSPTIFVPGATLRMHHASCTTSDADVGPCRAAINRYCAARGSVSGYGWIDGTDTWSVQCLDSTQATLYAISWPEVQAYQSMCSGFPANPIYCPPAVNDWCGAHGFAVGYGPVEQSPGNLFVLCLRDF